MDFASIEDRILPARQSALHALIPVFTVLISGLVIILAVSPEYLKELHPSTLLLLSVACALPVWACNQVLWRYTGRSISSAIVTKLTFILDVSEKRRPAYAFALSELLKAADVLRFFPHENVANLATVIAIYAGAALSYRIDGSPGNLYAIVFGLSVLLWAIGLFGLRQSMNKVDVAPLREFWHELKNRDDLLASIGMHFERIERALLSRYGESDSDGEASGRVGGGA